MRTRPDPHFAPTKFVALPPDYTPYTRIHIIHHLYNRRYIYHDSS
nr:MAG TPA: hypothetical protein [Caudoviricetes sp.]